MKTRQTWILLGVALALGAYIRLVELRPSRSVRDKAGDVVRFNLPELASIGGVEVQWSNQVIRVERDRNEWAVRHPVAARARSAAIDALLASLRKLQPSLYISPAELAREPSGLSAFGLQPPLKSITLDSQGRKVTLNIGRKAPVGNQFYFQRSGDSGVFVADAGVLALIPDAPHAWRDRQLVDFRLSDIDRFELRGRRELRLDRLPGTGGWRLTSPLAARADGDRVDAVISGLLRLQVAEFVSDRPVVDPESYGLAPPVMELILSRGTNEVVRLQFGTAATNAPGLVHVRNLIQTNVVLVSGEVMESVGQPASAFRDRRVAPSLKAASQIEFSYGTNQTLMERSGTNWMVTRPVRFPADGNVVSQLLNELGSMEIEDFVADVAANLAPYGLDTPYRQFTVASSATNAAGMVTNEPLLQLQVGRPLPTNAALVYARRLDEPGIVAIPRADFRLPETANQLRDWSFLATNVLEISVTLSNRSWVVRRAGAGWSNLQGTVLPEAVEETLFRLSRWTSERFAIRDVAAFEKAYRFASRSHEVTLVMRPGVGPVARWRLRFGADLGPYVVVLTQFDNDPVPLHLKMPRHLYEDLYRTFAPP